VQRIGIGEKVDFVPQRVIADAHRGLLRVDLRRRKRDVLKIRYNSYRELANAASTSQGRTTRSEVKFVSTVSVAAIQRKADDLASEYRELDTRIQEADWLTTLLD